MSFDRQEATEQPTATRLKRAREEGQVSRSSDLSSSLISLVAIGFAFLWLPAMMESSKLILSQGIANSSEDPGVLLMQNGSTLLNVLWLPCLVLFIGATFSGVIQVGGVFATSAAKFDYHRVDPTAGWTRVWGSRGWMNLAFSCFKLTAVVISAGAIGWAYKGELLAVSSMSLIKSISITGVIAGKMVFSSACCLFVLGLFDAAWQRYQWKEGLKMTRQEVITERREQEGNTNIRTHQKSKFLSRHSRGTVIPSLVLIGKTVGVLIRWNPTSMSTPVVLSFIYGEEIKVLATDARQKNIPVQTNHWLCKRIEQSCVVGSSIHPSLHSEIASILTTNRRKIA
ncbi:MAG: EscU/YscU/HrcU family type III secretion system export apparatus switch protein [Phycisphaerales bacterium]|jgi:flagellar biosynthesis protein FlhB|nr:EscU/YscU/HrcU family type III secretion system export apparatus switch protein [Phycisphaerales bacterium]